MSFSSITIFFLLIKEFIQIFSIFDLNSDNKTFSCNCLPTFNAFKTLINASSNCFISGFNFNDTVLSFTSYSWRSTFIMVCNSFFAFELIILTKRSCDTLRNVFTRFIGIIFLVSRTLNSGCLSKFSFSKNFMNSNLICLFIGANLISASGGIIISSATSSSVIFSFFSALIPLYIS